MAVKPTIGCTAILFIALGAGASGALNMWYDADIDRMMRRTRNRPVPAGKIAPGEALGLGLGLSGIAVVMLALATNILAALLLAFTIFFYAVVYTIWLKRRTPQNIVIGGAAGALPPVIGWLAATGSLSIEPVLMFTLIFIWTPPHFWALALFVKDDYSNAGVPMLTVTHGRRATRNQIFYYALALAVVSFALGLTSVGGPVYLSVALGANLWFVHAAWVVYQRDDAASHADHHAAEKRVFKYSLYYLFLHFGALMADAAIGGIV